MHGQARAPGIVKTIILRRIARPSAANCTLGIESRLTLQHTAFNWPIPAQSAPGAPLPVSQQGLPQALRLAFVAC